MISGGAKGVGSAEAGASKTQKVLQWSINSFKRFFSRPKTYMGWVARGTVGGLIAAGGYEMLSPRRTATPTNEVELADLTAEMQAEILNPAVVSLLDCDADIDAASQALSVMSVITGNYPGNEIRSASMLAASSYVIKSNGANIYSADDAFRIIKEASKSDVGVSLGIPMSDTGNLEDFRNQYASLSNRLSDFLVYFLDNFQAKGNGLLTTKTN
jgi:hypothetical protein